jgi:hypothetical protein
MKRSINMNKSGIHLVFFFICAGITIFSALSPIVVGQRMGPGMMYGYGPGYGINTTGSQTGYGPGYLMGPWMMYGYGPGYGINTTGSQTGYGPGYLMGPGMMYGYGPGYGINTTGSQTGYGPGYLMGPWMMYGYGPAYGMGPEVMYGYYGYGAGNSTSIADEISKLASLKKEGLITQDEYAKLKNRLIG